jgi:hypothetical protein
MLEWGEEFTRESPSFRSVGSSLEMVSHLRHSEEHNPQFFRFCKPKWRLFLNFYKHLLQILERPEKFTRGGGYGVEMVSQLGHFKEHYRQLPRFCMPKWCLFLNFDQH